MTVDCAAAARPQAGPAEPPEHPLAVRVPFVPRRSGVYLFKDRAGQVIYVGKAAVLRSRLTSYFGHQGGLGPRQRQLVARTTDFELAVTASEKEALLLEASLIKEHRPRYNIALRDDKSYLYLKITLGEPYPRIYTVRQVRDDGARYFGPYTDAKGLRATMAHLQRVFQFRTCDIDMEKGLDRPCLLYHIKRCLAPCIGVTTPEEYGQALDELVLFLDGKQDDVMRQLRTAMAAAAQELAFERAAAIRDRLSAAERVLERQRITAPGRGDLDAIAFALDAPDACVQVFQVRGDKVVSRENFVLQRAEDTAEAALLTHFLQQYYLRATTVPPVILLPLQCADPDAVAAWLSDRRGRRVRLEVPQRGGKRQLVALVAENAAAALEELKVKWLADERRTWGAVRELAAALDLPEPPRRIECYDISNIQGAAAVGSMVVFEQGRPRPDAYRRFRIKTVHQPDDFAMMAEVIGRRFRRAATSPGATGNERSEGATVTLEAPRLPASPTPHDNEPPEFAIGTPEDGPAAEAGQATAEGWELPELVIVDGGKGQLSAALAAMRAAGAPALPIIGLAKEQEEIFRPDQAESLVLPRTSQALYLIQRIRDEAHRFAITYHRSVRRRRTIVSALDRVPGIGPKRKRALLRQFGSVPRIREASDADLLAVSGMTKRAVAALREHL